MDLNLDIIWVDVPTGLHSASHLWFNSTHLTTVELAQASRTWNQPMSHIDKTPEGILSAPLKTFSVMEKKDQIRHQLRSCAEQMQQLLDQVNPTHKISRSLEASITRIQHFNKYDQPNVLSLWQDLLHEPRALPFRADGFSLREEFKGLLDRRAKNNLDIPILLVDTNKNHEEGLPGLEWKVEAHDTVDEFYQPPLKLKFVRKHKNDDDDELTQPCNECEEGLLGVEKKFEAHNITEKMHNPARKCKIVRRRMNDDYDRDDELNQPEPKRPEPSKKQAHIPF